MNMNPFPEQPDDERIPVTVMLTPARAARLEVLIANVRARDPGIDDNVVIDAVFDFGIALLDAGHAPMELSA